MTRKNFLNRILGGIAAFAMGAVVAADKEATPDREIDKEAQPELVMVGESPSEVCGYVQWDGKEWHYAGPNINIKPIGLEESMANLRDLRESIKKDLL